ncbi:hypothetical protein YC2023_073305 [Brassica napus]
MAAESPFSERCYNFLDPSGIKRYDFLHSKSSSTSLNHFCNQSSGRSSKDFDMVEIAPPAFASGSTTLEIQKVYVPIFVDSSNKRSRVVLELFLINLINSNYCESETELLKLGSVGFHGGNVIVDRNDISRYWSASLKSWTTLESGIYSID